MQLCNFRRGLAAVLFGFATSVLAQGMGNQVKPAEPAEAAKPAAAAPQPIDKAVCLGCHGNPGFAMPGADGKPRNLHVDQLKFESSVHGSRQCSECHSDITEIPHQKRVHKVSCVNCHEGLWAATQSNGKSEEYPRLGVVVKQIERHMTSVHARPNRQDQSYTNATCYDCHDAHYVYQPGTAERAEWKRSLPIVCGKCHTQSHQDYLKSVHADEAIKKRNTRAAVCSDCHTGHDIQPTGQDATKLAIINNCGKCHKENLRSYTDTYHGQVSTLGYTYTAKCSDCHANHTIKRVKDPGSRVHPNNRLQTCQQCHTTATAGFITFKPHANTHDFNRYPQMWIASKFMIALLLGVFAFFWTHSLLWFHREYRDRAEGKVKPHVDASKVGPLAQGRHVRRFAPLWRLAHLVFAISVMTLVLTGMAVFYADYGWARGLMNALGGPRAAATIHHTAAVIMLGIFFLHLVYVAFRIWRTRKTFDWFGPNSLLPRWKDLADAIAMNNWFWGKGPRPVFDRWTYWEKFDYWAVFWGMAIIGGSGFMLWFPTVTATFLPGWVFNVATLVHGEEAFLAAVFLFTVHFFNNHFRPDKLPPPDIVMFTGTMPLEEFKREHTLEYERLVATGRLEKCLVDAPSQPMRTGSRILGLVLIGIGLTLLALVIVGFVGNIMAA